ncbi:MAG TPA: hypothetical protein VGB98_25735 [Pyrinomonadaceae bacterium]|jgi:hypothetical protein
METRQATVGKRRASRRGRKPNRFDERTRFNWGYHDGALDYLHPEFTVRDLVNTCDPSKPRTSQVIKYEQPAYWYGYREGVEDARIGLYKRDSQQAWDRTSKHARVLVLRPTVDR